MIWLIEFHQNAVSTGIRYFRFDFNARFFGTKMNELRIIDSQIDWTIVGRLLETFEFNLSKNFRFLDISFIWLGNYIIATNLLRIWST